MKKKSWEKKFFSLLEFDNELNDEFKSGENHINPGKQDVLNLLDHCYGPHITKVFMARTELQTHYVYQHKKIK